MATTDKKLERTSSQASNVSRKSSNARLKSRKPSLVTPTSAKTLESFPSLSPDASPGRTLPQAMAVRTSFDEIPGTARKTAKTSPSIVEKLITSSPSFRGRSALFDDSPRSERKDDTHKVLGTLHHANDEQIQRLVQKEGAITLVRRLAKDVADRDVEISTFRRKAEERERELKRMLREVEVSNMDIEKRLRRLEGPEDAATVRHASMQKTGEAYGLDKDPGAKNGIDVMMGEAMKDDVGISELNEGYLDEINGQDRDATVKARSVLSKESDGKSLTSSIDSQGRPRSTMRGWKDYLWNGNTASRKTSGASSLSDNGGDYDETVRSRISGGGGNSKRKGLNDDLFSPPTRAGTTQSENTSRKSSTSAASWTMKLFGGNNQASRDSDGSSGKRGRSMTTDTRSKPSQSTSRTSDQVPPVPPIPQSAKAALMKVSGHETTLRPSKSLQPLKLGPGAASKSVAQKSPIPPSPANVDQSSNLGPVEMETIHPHDTKPPTLTKLDHKAPKSDDLLTDRFGFIYDQRRRKKQAQAPVAHKRGKSSASANVEMIGGVRQPMSPKDNDQLSLTSKADSVIRPDTPMSQEDRIDGKPTKRWQDYLKVATFPTELLSHTPTAQTSPIISTPDSPNVLLQRSSTTDARTSHPSISLNPEPEISPITAHNAEITRTSSDPSSDQPSTSGSDVEPVKLLLSQLTELHDSLQRDKTVRWNHFLHRVNAERKKERETAATTDSRSKKAASTPEVTLTDGEMIGIAGLGNKGKVGRAKWKEFKSLVLSGIPVAYRAKTWTECSGASALRVPGYYDDLVADDSNDDKIIVAQIEMDIHRTLTDNVFFRHGPGVSKLAEVLLAYSRRNPEVGYCQGMNLITASLLLIMPTAEDAFWLLTSLIENILPRHYYDKSLLASRADQQVLRQYVTSILPRLSVHLDDLGIELEALTFQWFLSIFTDCLSAEALFRVWDVIFCLTDGSTFLFQVALALLKLNEQQLLECDSPARVYGYIGNEVTDHAISIDGLIAASEGLKGVVIRGEVEERRWAAVEEARDREKQGRSRGASGSTGAESRTSLVIQEPRPFEG